VDKHYIFGELRADLPRHWVEPTLGVEVEYRQRLKGGPRHAVLEGLRPEKKPAGDPPVSLHRAWPFLTFFWRGLLPEQIG
jgi:hypothetical protein